LTAERIIAAAYQQINSVTHFFANSRPEMSLNETGWPLSIISAIIFSTSSLSKPSSSAGSGGRSLPLLLLPAFLAPLEKGRLAPTIPVSELSFS
jgi:hypothetical protein